MRQSFMVLLCFIVCSGTAAAQISVELEKMNVVIEGIQNAFSLVHEVVPDSHIVVIPSCGNILKEAPFQYIWKVGCSEEKVEYLTILDTVQHDTLDIKAYRIRELVGKPLLGTIHGSKKMASTKFKGQGGLAAVVMGGYGFDLKFLVTTFEVVRIHAGRSEYCLNKGGRFQSDCAVLVGKAEVGDTYVIQNIEYRSLCRTKKYGEDLVFTIVESEQ